MIEFQIYNPKQTLHYIGTQASKQFHRPMLTNVNVVVTDGHVKLLVTNSYVASEIEFETEEVKGLTLSFPVSAQFFIDTAKRMRKGWTCTMYIDTDNKMLGFGRGALSDVRFVESFQGDRNYPDLTALLDVLKDYTKYEGKMHDLITNTYSRMLFDKFYTLNFDNNFKRTHFNPENFDFLLPMISHREDVDFYYIGSIRPVHILFDSLDERIKYHTLILPVRRD